MIPKMIWFVRIVKGGGTLKTGEYFKMAKDPAQNCPRKEKSASEYVAHPSEVTSDFESAEEEI